MAALAFGVAHGARADDLELFMQASTVNPPKPNVIIVVDTSSNWSTRFASEKAALLSLVNYFGSGGERANVNVAVMMGNRGNADGGYLRFSLRDMSVAANREALKATISSFVNDAQEKSNNPTPANAFAEVFRYLTGGAAINGTASDFREYFKNPNVRSPWGAYWLSSATPPDAASCAFSSSAATVYNQPASVSQACARNYIIYISNGKVSGGQAAETSTACNLLSAAGGDITQLPITPNQLQTNCVDEWARFLAKKDFASSPTYAGLQNVASYVIEVEPATDTTSRSMTSLMKSVANAGGGDYIKVTDASTSVQMQTALETIFNQIQSVNSVFASASLPVSVNQRSTNLNQVYIGVFRPDGSARPRWPGNLKQYKLGYDEATRNLYLADTAGASAVDGTTGFLKNGATSFWTKNSQYWAYSPDPQAVTPDSDLPDGPLVERGGAGQLQRMNITATALRTAASRRVLTYTGTGSNVALTSACASCQFSTANTGITAAALGTTATDRDGLINWARGANNNNVSAYADAEFGITTNVNGSPVLVDVTDIRPSVQADVLHSRPAVINYNRMGTMASPDPNDVVVFYGSNDGTLRAIQGGQANALTGDVAGTEKWAFVARENFARLQRLRDNVPPISPPGVTGPVTMTLKTTAGSNVLENATAAEIASLRRNMTATATSIPAGTWVVGFIACPAAPTKVCPALSANATANGNVAVVFTPNERPYFWDGALTTWTNDANNDGRITVAGGDKAYLFATARRGGRFVYAFDVTDPENPILMWRRGCTLSGACDAGWEEVGQTWSAATPTKVAASMGASNPQNVVLVMGAGYDARVEDLDPVAGTRSMGRGIYVINAVTGAIVHKWVASAAATTDTEGTTTRVAAMTHAIPSDVAVVARSHATNQPTNGYRAYVGDTGGNVWRIDIANANPSLWAISRLAQLGGTGANARKFLFPPDVVFAGQDSTGPFDYVLLGSGDREHPLQGLVDGSGNSLNVNYPASVAITNRFYMIKDRAVAESYDTTNPVPTATLTESDLYDTTADLIQLGTTSEAAVAKASLNSTQGWYITLTGIDVSGNTNPGEKAVSGATTAAGVVFFGTNRPIVTLNACSVNLGEAKLYAVSITDGTAIKGYFNNSLTLSSRFQTIPGGGFPPTPVPVAMNFGNKKVEGIISGVQARTTASGFGDRLRTFIRVEYDRPY